MTVEHIYISPEHNYFGHHGQPAGTSPIIELYEASLVAGKGIEGDRFFGWKEDYKGQITFFSHEVYQDVCASLGVINVPPSVFRRNVIVSGIDLNSLIDQEFELQGIRFRGICECSPCHWMDEAFHPGAESALKGRGGLRARILTSGILRRR
ncbi:MAG: MOSC domain-containing protein YiiM [Verrucomicrobia bacterium]|nr:MAG: MOSC domain-containing protein YiiM [Verrucomicrobiota bacterium]